jgi:hypothetical protein
MITIRHPIPIRELLQIMRCLMLSGYRNWISMRN